MPEKNKISTDEKAHGAMVVPIVLSSDATVASNATGHTAFHPVYISVGNLHNHARRSYKRGVALLGYLPMPVGAMSHHLACSLTFSADIDPQGRRRSEKLLNSGSLKSDFSMSLLNVCCRRSSQA
jgi:hypothetical protein